MIDILTPYRIFPTIGLVPKKRNKERRQVNGRGRILETQAKGKGQSTTSNGKGGCNCNSQ